MARTQKILGYFLALMIFNLGRHFIVGQSWEYLFFTIDPWYVPIVVALELWFAFRRRTQPASFRKNPP